MMIWKDLQKLEGIVWEDNINKHISGVHVLLWHAIEEVASFIEVYLPIEQAESVAPKALAVLEGGREYFAELDVPRPYGVELILLQLARHKAGLDPHGEE